MCSIDDLTRNSQLLKFEKFSVPYRTLKKINFTLSKTKKVVHRIPIYSFQNLIKLRLSGGDNSLEYRLQESIVFN